jgi:hypothetical protein
MHLNERTWPAGKRETRAQFAARLEQTARSIPEDFIRKAMRSLKGKLADLEAADGWYFE